MHGKLLIQISTKLRLTTPRVRTIYTTVAQRSASADTGTTTTASGSDSSNPTAPPPDSSTTTNNATVPVGNRLKMGGWQIHSYGDLEELQYTDKLKMPRIRFSSECLVRVHATSVNPIDVAMLGGYGATVINAMRCMPNGIEFPITLGREFCGELVQRGMGVDSTLALGERVWGVVPLHSHGAHAEYVVVPDFCLSPVPSLLTNEEAASVLYAGLTAWSGLYITGGLGGITGALGSTGGSDWGGGSAGGAHKRILVLGGSGSVGSLAIQMLKAQGAHVLTTCSEDAVELVRSLGADVVVDYKNPVEMEQLNNYAPFDIVLDCAGKGADYAQELSFRFGQYITFNSPLLRNIDSSGIGLGLLKNIANLMETNVKSLSRKDGLVKWGFFAPAPNGIQFLKNLVERKKLLPTVDSVYNFSDMPEAFKKVKEGHLRGKVVVNILT